MTEISSSDIEVNGVTLRVCEAGDRGDPTVLLCHGFPDLSFSWRHQMAPLAEAGFHVVAPDQRGYAVGARPADVAQYHVDHLVADVMGFADALGADRFHLVGHDWGGFIAWYVGVLSRKPRRLPLNS